MMKAKTFKELLNAYAKKSILHLIISLLIMGYCAYRVSDMPDVNLPKAMILFGLLIVIWNIFSIKIFNMKLYVRYQRALQRDAVLMVEQLKDNHLGNPDKLSELEQELIKADIIKK